MRSVAVVVAVVVGLILISSALKSSDPSYDDLVVQYYCENAPPTCETHVTAEQVKRMQTPAARDAVDRADGAIDDITGH